MNPELLLALSAALGLGVGSLGTLVWQQRRLAEAQRRYQDASAANNNERQQHAVSMAEMETRLSHALQQADALTSAHQDLQAARHNLATLEESLSNARRREQDQREYYEQRIANLEASRQEVRDELRLAREAHDDTRHTLQVLERQHQALTTRAQEQERHFEEKMALLNDSREQLKLEFHHLANEILEQKGKAFSTLSQKNIGELLQPMQNEMKGFREKMERLHTDDTAQRASLRTELENLQKLNREITDQAHKLTEALRGQKKVQGNWGELMLENVLDSAGLRLGKDYQREVSFNTDDGRRRPDAVVYLPQGKHLVIDAKTSLSAYVRYVNSDDELERHQALAEHAKAVKDRIQELADKHYYDLPGLNSPEVVVMFIPVESAYVEALKFDDQLYQQAIRNHVLVATPTTLLTSLNIVAQLWRFEDQSKHSAELADRAGKFYDKLRLFLESMEDVGKKIDGARESYDSAMNRLVSGRSNLIKQASEFQSLGVAVKKELPEDMVDKAKLELGEK